jgi:hypothetical protein
MSLKESHPKLTMDVDLEMNTNHKMIKKKMKSIRDTTRSN